MNEALYNDNGEFVGFCYTHQGRKILQDNVDGCQHPVCINLRQLPDSTSPMWNIERFKAENRDGYTQSELEKDTIEAAKRDGREISRVR